MPPKSGSLKRKERVQKDAKYKKLRGSFDRFLPSKNVNSTSVLNDSQENVGAIIQTEKTIAHLCYSDDSICTAEKVIKNSTIHFKSTETSVNKVITLKSSAQENIGEIIQTENTIAHLCYSDDSICTKFNLKNDYPTDRYHFDENTKDSNLKRLILKYGSCLPNIQFPYTENENGKSYRFSKHYYFMKLKSGLIVPRNWLCYSVGLDVMYCETCWLFANRLHEKSIQHIDAIKVRCTWDENETIDKSTEQKYSNEAAYWRNVLQRIIKIILSLTSGNTALRGHLHKGKFKEQEYISKGNFMLSVKILAEFDPVINE
ncbi:zinc finger MYM-type protein 1-like [Aphis craccivora]|uniref:Zinc finger MYM-type protein 1-like n=1 Tax=Aphis craccivora TaxID=307492 RepID=A0A6G0Y4P9_APHCR|nr:zinc finger MYM-type protein 1-like [Aphis craccivora]